MSRDGAQLGRDYSLDGLRGIAILLVIALHTLHLQQSRLAWSWVNAVLKSGWIGVDLFFVLSGFLITSILIATRDHPQRARNFYMRRALRILPAYYVYLALTMLVLVFVVNQPVLTDQALDWLPSLLFFAQNLTTAISVDTPPVREFNHLWSLAIEEQFYLLWPWLVWRLDLRALPRVCLIVIASAWGCKMLLAATDVWEHGIYVLPFTRMDGLAAGAYLAAHRALGGGALPAWMRPLPWFGLLILLTVFFLQRGLLNHTAHITVLNTCATVLLFAGLLHRTLVAQEDSLLRRILANPVLLFFGRYSYGLYLIHYGVDTWMRLYAQPLLETVIAGNLMRVFLASGSVALSVLLAMLLHRWVEAPALRLKTRFEYSQRPA